MPNDAYYAEVAQYLNNYIWRIADRLPTSDGKLWESFEGRTADYPDAAKIRGPSTSTGKGIKRNCIPGNR